MNNYQYSSNGLALTKSFEGLRLEAYQDCGGIWTIGYGHRGQGVCAGLIINEDQATQFLYQDVQIAAQAVSTLVTMSLNQNQFDALVDFCFNVGQGSLTSSTLLRLVNLGDLIGAYGQFALWVYAGGEIEPGLVARRKAEASMFRSGVAA